MTNDVNNQDVLWHSSLMKRICEQD